MNQLDHRARLFPALRRVVLKIGSSLLAGSGGIERNRITAFVKAIAELSPSFTLVTSGAVAAGVRRLGREHRPRTIPEKQATAAIGQIDLMRHYQEAFAAEGKLVGQILLTRDDLSNRRRYLNAKHTLDTLLDLGAVPIVNENDSVVVEEIKFGDNDRLSASVAVLVEADLLVILSDVDGLHTEDPRTRSDAARVAVLSADDEITARGASGSRGWTGTGGMATKIDAARKAAAAGIPTLIVDGTVPDAIHRALDPGLESGTLVLPSGDRLGRRKHWIAHTLHAMGSLELDEGAAKALRTRGGSLLPKGVSAVQGEFGAGECVACVDAAGGEVARGLVNYSSAELRKIVGAHSRDIEALLGYKVSDEVIHRDDLVLS